MTHQTSFLWACRCQQFCEVLSVKFPFLFSQLSVRGKEPVCRTKCVFTLDFVDVNLDFTGTSAKPVSSLISSH